MRFGWMNGDEEQEAPITPPTYITDLGYHGTSSFLTSSMVDLNGDGLLDWVMAWRAKWGQVHKQTWLQTQAGTWQHAPRFTLPGDGFSVLYDYYENREEPLKNGLLQDVNGDGLPDWVLAHSYGNKIIVKKTWINTGSGWWLDERYTLPDVITDTTRFPSGENHGTFVDLNGDGLVDWVTAWKGNYHNGSKGVWINKTNAVKGNVWVRDDRWNLPDYLINYTILFDKPGSNLHGQLIDVNGDGLPDYVCSLRDRSGNVKKSTYLNTGSGWRREDSYLLPDLYIDYTQAGGMVYGSFVDVNGDGLVDWVRAFRNPWGHDSMATFLNTGRGWLQDDQYRMLNVIYDYREYIHKDPRRRIIQRHGAFVDINGDGLIDWLQSYRSRNLNTWHNATFLNTGTTWVNKTGELPPPEIIHDYSLSLTHQYSRGFDHGLFADIDGDGRKDWVQTYRDRNSGVHQSTFSYIHGGFDVIATFQDEIGAEVRVEYKPMTDGSVYEEDPSWTPKATVWGDSSTPTPADASQDGGRFYDRYPVRKVASTNTVVARAMTRSYSGWRTWDYRYGLSRYDIRYGWQGFAWLKRWDVDKEVQRVKSLYQEFPLSGRLKAVENKKHVKLSLYSPIGEQVRYSYLVNGTAPKDGCDRYPCTVLLSSKETEQYELNSSLVTRQVVDNEAFDGFGNVASQRLLYSGNPEQTAEPQASTLKEVVYENRTDQWLLGLPVSETTTHSQSGRLDRSRLKEASFNQYGEPEILLHDQDNTKYSLTETFSYDGFGNVVDHVASGSWVKDRTTTTEYDASGHHPIGVTNSLGHRTIMNSFESRCGEHTSVTDPNGLTTSFAFDQWCRPSRQTRPDDVTTTFSYDYDYSWEYSIHTDTSGYPPTIARYDFLGNLQQEQTYKFDKWLVKEFTYDNFNRILSESVPFSGDHAQYHTKYAYDKLDRVISQTTPDGATTTKEYKGLTTVVTNHLQQATTESKGPRGETLQVIDAEGHTLSYIYDASGNLVFTRDPHGNIIELVYDALDRKIATLDPDLGNWIYKYNAFGELISQADGKAQTTAMAYDQLGRMIERYSSEGVSTWSWDTATGGIGLLAEARGSEYEYVRRHSYDPLGRPRSTTVDVEGGGSFTTTWRYDNYSRLEQVIHPDDIIEQHAYTNQGTLFSTTISQGETQLSNWQLEEVDDWGHATRETINGELTLSKSYDPRRGRVERTSAAVGEQQVQDLSYGWDPIGNLNRRINEQQQREELFDYDRINRLVASRGDGGGTEVEYDAIGNILWKSDVGRYTYGQNGAGPHAVTMVDVSEARNPVPFSAFNPSGNYSYDNNGNLLSGGGRNVEWTILNMPRRITGANGVDTYFLYGPEGQRIVKDSADGKLTVYLSAVHKLELDANERTTSRLTLPLGSAVAEILLNDAGTQARYMLMDHLGSPDVILDQDLAIVEQLSFDPWGKRRQEDWSPAEQAIASSTPTGFTGHEMDDETGLINMAARLYDPLLGRFLSADTLIPHPGNLQSYNRYSYVLNNPLRYVDPTGHEDDDSNDLSGGGWGIDEEEDTYGHNDTDLDGKPDEKDEDPSESFKPAEDKPQEVAEKPTKALTTSQRYKKDAIHNSFSVEIGVVAAVVAPTVAISTAIRAAYPAARAAIGWGFRQTFSKKPGKELADKSSKTPAQRLADKAQGLPSSERPNTVSAINHKDGTITVGKNQGGVQNSTVQNAVNNAPQNNFGGQCAEVNAASRALNKGRNLEGAEISTANVRGPNSTSGVHGTSKAPCETCTSILDELNIKVNY